MRVIGVIDLSRGRAVHARGGVRSAYESVRAAAGRPIHGEPRALARAYVEVLGLTDVYVADLDAIDASGRNPPQISKIRGEPHTATGRSTAAGPSVKEGGASVHPSIIREVADLATLWLDAGVSSIEGASRANEQGATRVVIGLETLDSIESLTAICADVGRERIAFSLDTREGRPVAPRLASSGLAPAALAAHAADAGVGAVIVLDLARVGSNRGPNTDLVRQVRAALPSCLLVSGGGVRDAGDLRRLREAGSDAALVATALHDGRLDADALRRVAQPSVSR